MAQVGYGSITITDLTDTLNTQHFWWSAEGESEDVPGGAYITNTSIKEFKANPTGGNLLTRSDGLWLRNGVNKLVSLTAEGLSFFTPEQSIAAEITSNGLNITKGDIKFDGHFNMVNTNAFHMILFEGVELTGSEINPHEEGWYEYNAENEKYLITNDITIKENKQYYKAFSPSLVWFSVYVYNNEIQDYEKIVLEEEGIWELIVNPDERVNPQENGWYELIENNYVLTDDTVINSGKEYYQLIELYFLNVTNTYHYWPISPLEYYWYEKEEKWEIILNPDENANPRENGWYELINGNYELTDDTEVNPEKEYYQLNESYFLTADTEIVLGKRYYRAGDGCITLSNYNFNREIVGTLRENLRLAIGENFGVASDGTLYATKAVFSGNVEINAGTTISKEAINSSLGTSDIVEDLTNLQGEVNELSALQVTVTDEQAKILGSLDFGVIEETPVLSIKADANSPLTMQLTNSELRFLENNNPVASISNQLLQIEDATIVNQLQFGDFAFIPRTNGNLALKYIGE